VRDMCAMGGGVSDSELWEVECVICVQWEVECLMVSYGRWSV